MGLRPCAGCHRRFVGKGQWIYVTVLLHGDERRRKGSCCQSCFGSTVDWVAARAERVPDDGILVAEDEENSPCIACKEHADDGYCLFVTDYATQSDRRDWFGRLCKACALGAASVLEDGMPVAT